MLMQTHLLKNRALAKPEESNYCSVRFSAIRFLCVYIEYCLVLRANI